MPIVPSFKRETTLNATNKPYMNVNVNGDMFGANVAQAVGNMGDAAKGVVNAALRIQDTIDDAKFLELSNNIDKWEQDNLYDKENGYYYKMGKDAVGKSPEVMKNYDDFIEQYKAENIISPHLQRRIDDLATKKRSRISYNVNRHDFNQTGEWARLEGKKATDNAILGMVHARNNPDEMNIQLANGLQALEWQGKTQQLDSDTIDGMKKDFKSISYCAVLDSMLQEGSLEARNFYEKHKKDITPNAQAKYIGAIRNMEIKYEARDTANDIIASTSSLEEAVKKAEKIKDIDLSDRVVSHINRHYREEEQFKNEAEKQALDGFYNTVVQKMQTGENISYDDIPDNIDARTKLSLMNYVNQNGQPETDNEVWETLYDMSVNNAQGFAKEDLNKYRGFLSDGEYKSFVKKQQDIQDGKFYTQIKDDDKMIDAALKTIGLDRGKKNDVAYSEIRSLVRELEARKGRKITDDELSNIVNSLGYKDGGVQLYKQIEKGMASRTGFVRDVMNDFAYYQSKHNGELPPDDEKMKIINKRITTTTLEQNQELNNSLQYQIQRTQAKPNETKELTYYADSYLPKLGNEMGVRFTIVEGGRYRAPNGKYKSNHSKGTAADVSMSEHSVKTRLDFIEKQLANPQVKKIGTSDPNILAKYGKNPKIEDERNFDKQYGTNHVNHAHITLNAKGVKMQAPDGRIVIVPQHLVQQAIKNGGVRL